MLRIELRGAAIAFWLVVTLARGAAGQTRDPSIGTKVRFRPVAWREYGADANWMEGRVTSVATDTVSVRICSRCREPIRAVTPLATFDIEGRVGAGGSRGANSRFGAVVGAIAGLVYTGYRVSSCPSNDDLCGLEWIAAPLWSAGGAAIGALVGAVVIPGRWEAWTRR